MYFPQICGKTVVSHLAKNFGVDLATKKEVLLNQEEKKLADRLSLMIRMAATGELVMSDRHELVRNEDEDGGDEDWDFEEEEGVETKREISQKMLDEALAFYRSGKRKRNHRGEGIRSFESMKSRFRWFNNESVLKLMIKYERTGVFPAKRNIQLEKLANDLNKEVEDILNQGLQFSDFELRELALSINREKKYWEKFKCSESWLLKWKKRFRICGRRITEFVSTKTERDAKKTLELVETLRKDIETVFINNPGIEMWNCDQTGLVKESHSMRTLARKGSRKVKILVQSKSATTHSITLLPIIGCDGFQHEKLFVQLGEPKGRLPKSGCYTSSKMELAVGTSHIMSRETAGEFFKNVLFGGYIPPKLILLLDSWPIFKDHAYIRSFAPPTVDLHIFNIPPGATSLCQPADLSYNRQVKGIQKQLTTMVLFRNIDYRLSARDNLLKLACQIHWVLGAVRFQPFIAYGFFQGGFVKTRPPPFEGPKQYIFGPKSYDSCSCSAQGCTLCPKCEKSYCFNCFWVNLHRC
ncbi:hypothetical protein B9Z55_021960 [Caenorhabditis nigoni]|uniref:Transposase Tc5 C-terminal domain-containing protein n=1 Tax=Caenorhabditis nigoni TaxID=1611254 RepID=A0A2G5TUB8_9PELO|nr:hypothetical protein B9Z55_021960 [Caenorhabditis nigoni]